MTTPPMYADLPAVADVGEAADVLKVSEDTVRRLIAAGALGHVRLGRLIRVPRHYLVAFLDGEEPPG